MSIKLFSIVFISLLFLSGCAPEPSTPVDFVYIMNNKEVREFVENKNNKNYTIGLNKHCNVGEEIILFEIYNKKIKEKTSDVKYKALIDSINIKKDLVYEVRGKSKSNNSHLFLFSHQENSMFRFLKINVDGTLASNHLYDWDGRICMNNYINTSNQKIFERIDEHVEREEIFLKGSYSYSIIYTGKDSNSIKLQYREYKDDMARIAFYQDLTYDLKESKIIRFKKFKIEILKADNEGIEYKVLED
ncbi:MAG: hypothetical protein NTZ60_00010 [Campylobacterales bacterium]|nr:hypothetical protein [Campylobacterales bacterium]